MLKKTSAYIGLVIATAAGAVLANSSANAQVDLTTGSHHRFHHRSHNRNWNGNHHRGRIFIRIYIYNKNNNRAIAIARPERDRSPLVVRRPERILGDGGGTETRRAATRSAATRGAETRGARTRDDGTRSAGSRDDGTPSNSDSSSDRRPASTNEGTSGGASGQVTDRDNQAPAGERTRSNDESFGDAAPTS